MRSSKGVYSTKETYRREQEEIRDKQEQGKEAAFKRLWKIRVPRRVQAIVWKILKNRLPTRTSLQRRGVIDVTMSTVCPMCTEEEETIQHLFFKCLTTAKVWTAIYKWTGMAFVPHIDLICHFLQHADLLGNQDKEEVASSLWVGTMWAIWNMRNKLIFDNENPNIEKMFREIKAWTWQTSLAKAEPQLSFRIWC